MAVRRTGLGFLIWVGSLIPAVVFASGVGDDAYPTRPITLVIEFPAGDREDLVARHLAEALADDLGQRVVVSNQPGGAGNAALAAMAAMAAMAKADADGYTVRLAMRPAATPEPAVERVPEGHSRGPFSARGIDVSRDGVPVGLIAHLPHVLVMGKHVAAETLPDVVALAKESPGEFTCASTGSGSTTHILCDTLGEKAGVSWTHVPYGAGGTSAITDVIEGEVDFAVVTVASALRFIKWDLVRPLAVFSESRVVAIPSVPAIAEHGYADLEAQDWYAIVAPSGTPPQAVSRLNRAINEAYSDVELQKRMVKLGYVLPSPESNTPDAVRAFISGDAERQGEVLEPRGMKGL
ncbi:tripartite tricarboxylate transporter substrate binding protein [Bordetella sp. LUAb4]|uniref:Bug family tripartite tricarboxylate transporter substrate binding protein n=1 Tax=Bordetella sp. LUAb4 TaxID=2843195 RepID=UPI001E348872|nr:tripartite tricarboxylate transporter substrate binding protein [Bordetella sp. LUAb4]